MSHWEMLTVAQERSGEEPLSWEGKLKRLPVPPLSFLLGFLQHQALWALLHSPRFVFFSFPIPLFLRQGLAM